ncbi:MAG TPA: PEPxxWA-CTERM sorting domain-containing protein [Phenylobacterium sp.]|jgi:hypothetical protein|uniref:PEPxxWA-CTERM sorting domain-containing protein n=1 Tax=Phenylobacterium sp. TaxID=1871053 RepID=UPI002D4F0C56|nr:PEPxxWA-CTERM sorting domain-containing protein [Phenylobacterium sp.]HZZ69148.1 PEPxxWA-CTERM sorting domain-containing protein [Phenylobacterium sp.]
MGKVLLAAASAVAIAWTAGAAQAGVIVNTEGVFDASIDAFGPLGQTFVAIDSNLVSIGFAYSDLNPTEPNDPVTVSLYSGAGGLDSSGHVEGTLIASQSVTLPLVLPTTGDPPSIIDTDFSGVHMTVGDAYTAVVSATSFKVAVVYGADGYDQGNTINNLSECSTGCDLDFRIVGSDATGGVPEPASWALLITGFGGVGAMLRRGRSARFAAA